MRQVSTASAPAAASRGDVAKRAPAFVRPSALPGVRLKTASENPAFRMFCAIPIPIRPRPTNPTFSTPFVIAVLIGCSGDDAVGEALDVVGHDEEIAGAAAAVLDPVGKYRLDLKAQVLEGGAGGGLLGGHLGGDFFKPER